VALDSRGTVTVAWTEQREHARRVVVVRIPPGRLPGRPHQIATGRSVGPAAAAGAAVAWAQDGRMRIAERAGGARALDVGPAFSGRAPALAVRSGRLAAAWHAPGRSVLVRDPAGRVVRASVDDGLRAGPQVGLDGAGQATVAFEDGRGVLALAVGGRAQLLGSADDAATFSGLSVASSGRALVTFLGGDGNDEPARPELVKVAARPAGAAFLEPVTVSKHAPIASLSAATVVPGGGEVVSWATSIGASGSGLLFVTTRARAGAAAAALASPAPAAEPGLIA